MEKRGRPINGVPGYRAGKTSGDAMQFIAPLCAKIVARAQSGPAHHTPSGHG